MFKSLEPPTRLERFERLERGPSFYFGGTGTTVPQFLQEVHERNLAGTLKDDYEDCNTFDDGIAYFLTVDEMGHLNEQIIYITEQDYSRIVEQRKKRSSTQN